jgi:twitching motility protein PilT
MNRDAELKAKFESQFEVDFSKELNDLPDFVATSSSKFRELPGISRNPAEIRSFEELGLPDVLKRWALIERGLVILTGPTGSGKTPRWPHGRLINQHRKST